MSELFLILCEIIHHVHQVPLQDKVLELERDGWKIKFNGTANQATGIHHSISYRGSPVGISTPAGAALMAGVGEDLMAWCRLQPRDAG